MKKMKKVHLIETLVISLVAVLIGFFVLLSTGKISDNPSNDNTLIFESEGASKEYDGKELVNNTYKLVQGQIAEGQKIIPLFTGKQTSVGVSDNLFIISIMQDDIDVTSLYNIRYIYGKLTVNKRNLKVETASAEKIYDGLTLRKDEYIITEGSLLKDHKLDLDFYSVALNAGSIKNKANCSVKDKHGNSVDNIYDIEVIEGTLKIKPKIISIVSSSNSKVYDTLPLEDETYEVVDNGLINNDTIELFFTNKITKVGKIDNSFFVKIHDINGNNITSNYEIEKIEGVLEVLPREITISTPNDEKIYDGTPLTSNDYTIVDDEILEGDIITVKNISTITKVGEIDNDISCTINNKNGDVVTNCYVINKALGTLKVIPREITVTTGSEKKYYDGKVLTSKDFEIHDENLLEGDYVVAETIGKITEVGKIKNDIIINIFDKDNKDCSNCYKINKVLGSLEIIAIPLKISTDSSKKDYDGLPLSNSNIIVEPSESLLPGHEFVGKVNSSITMPGKIPNIIENPLIVDKNGCIMNDKYDITIDEGSLEIKDPTKIDISKKPFESEDIELYKLKSDFNGKLYMKDNVYANYELTNWGTAKKQYYIDKSFTNPQNFIADSLLLNESKVNNISITELQTGLPDLYPYFMINQPEAIDDLKYNTNYTDTYDFQFINYNFFKNGKLKINDILKESEANYKSYLKEVYLQIPNTTKRDLLALATLNDLSPTSDNIILEVAKYIQNAATYNMHFEEFPNDCDMAVYFLETAKEGICQHFATAATMMYRALGIPARYVTGFAPTLSGVEKVCTGKEGHAWVEVYIDEMGWIPVEVTGPSKSEGSGGGGFRPGSFNNFKQDKIFIKPMNLKKQYDGKPLNAENKLEGLEEFVSNGYTYTAKVTGSQTNYGRGISTIEEFKLFDYMNKDVTNEFQIIKNKGYLYVYRQELYIKTDSKEKVYDGFYYKNRDYELTGNVDEGHRIDKQSFKFIEPFKNVSRILNTVDFKIKDENDKDVTNEYFIIKDFGIYEIKPKDLTITTSSKSKKFDLFDDEPLISLDYSVDGLIEQVDKIEIKVIGLQDGIGHSKNTFIIEKLTDISGEDSMNNYNIIYNYGTLEIYI